jgi:hypothetical protein
VLRVGGILVSLLKVCRSDLRRLDRRLKKHPHSPLAKKLAGRRRQLQIKIDAFLDKTPISIGGISPKEQSGSSNEQLDRHAAALEDGDDDNDDIEDDGTCSDLDILDEEDDSEDEVQDPTHRHRSTCDAPEQIVLPLPSRLGLRKPHDETIALLIEDELKIRQSQASEALDQVRLSLGIKSAIFRKQVAPAKSQQKKTRAWKAVHVATAAVQRHARSYGLAQHALVELEAKALILTRFPALQKCDLVVSRDVVEENRVGQRSEHISWIWRLDIGHGLGKDKWMEESE